MDTEPRATAAPARPRRPRHLPGVEGIWVFVFADMTVFGILALSQVTEFLYWQF